MRYTSFRIGLSGLLKNILGRCAKFLLLRTYSFGLQLFLVFVLEPCKDTQKDCSVRAASGDCWKTAQPSKMFYVGKQFPLWDICPESCRRCNGEPDMCNNNSNSYWHSPDGAFSVICYYRFLVHDNYFYTWSYFFGTLRRHIRWVQSNHCLYLGETPKYPWRDQTRLVRRRSVTKKG